jgi:hypothetical protein
MHYLPKANPLYEHISAQEVFIPDVLEKLGKGGFTGYISHTAQNFESCCLFAKGKLICVISTEDGRDKTGFEAIALLFNRVLRTGGEINVYRMTSDLAMCAHALVLGTKLYDGDEVRQVDIKRVLAQLKAQGHNGVVRFYTKDRYALILYKNGQPVGFCRDGSLAIETSPEESLKVAALPGARLEVCATKPIEELMHYDLLQMVNLTKLWEAADGKNSIPRKKELATPAAEEIVLIDEKLAELVDDLIEVAAAYLSREGRGIIEINLRAAGGSTILFDSAKTLKFLEQVEKDSRIIDSHARIDEMIDLMKSEIAGRLAV